MKVLLTGATGFLGFRTLEKLVLDDRISAVLATGRTLKNTHHIDHLKINYRLGDLTDADFVNGLVAEVDTVINVAALSSPWGKEEEFVRANVLTQENLIQAALTNSIKRFVYVSTPSLYFRMADQLGIRESDPLPERMVNGYASTKRRAEIKLIDAGLPHVILRPRALIGRGDTVIMPRLIKAYDAGRLKIIGDGKNLVDLTPVGNVADAILLGLFVNDEGLNEIYNISNGKPINIWDHINRVMVALNRAPLKRKIPFPLVKMVAQLMEWKSRLADGKEPVLTVYSVAALAKSFSLDISKAQEKLGYRPETTVEEAIENFVAWYRSNDTI